MGTYRFVLAALVLYSHAFGAMFGLAPAVVVVISFFVISGYLMSILMERTYPTIQNIPAFYLDRAARLFPQYLFYVVAVLIMMQTIGLNDPGVADRGLWHIVANLAMLPVGYYMFGLQNAVYNPPAWSLGLELTFYLAFPFFWLLPRIWKYAALAVSISVFAYAYIGGINSDFYGYRLLPGTFFIFIAGAGLAYPGKVGKYYSATVAMLMFTAFAAQFVIPNWFAYRPYNFDVALGTAIGVAAVALLKNVKRSKIDEFFGNLSYGAFLSHYPLIFLADRFGWNRWAIVPIGSVVLAFVSYELVEKPALQLRHRLRDRRRLELATSQAGDSRAPALSSPN